MTLFLKDLEPMDAEEKHNIETESRRTAERGWEEDRHVEGIKTQRAQ